MPGPSRKASGSSSTPGSATRTASRDADVEIERVALPAGDYAVAHGEAMAAAVERKTFENFTASLSDGTLAFQMHA